MKVKETENQDERERKCIVRYSSRAESKAEAGSQMRRSREAPTKAVGS